VALVNQLKIYKPVYSAPTAKWANTAMTLECQTAKNVAQAGMERSWHNYSALRASSARQENTKTRMLQRAVNPVRQEKLVQVLVDHTAPAAHKDIFKTITVKQNVKSATQGTTRTEWGR
jgi:hypothetical protein